MRSSRPRAEPGYTVTTNKTSYDVRAVLLAIGRRGSPRQLGVPGEDLPKVAYRLIDAEQYREQHVLVVGGGDSALEAATSIAAEPGTNVTLSYRSGAFNRAKQKNREKVEAAAAAGKLRVLFSSNVKEIHNDSVDIAVGEKTGKLKKRFRNYFCGRNSANRFSQDDRHQRRNEVGAPNRRQKVSFCQIRISPGQYGV